MERMTSWLPAAKLPTPGCDHNDDEDKVEEKKDLDEQLFDKEIDDFQSWA